MILEEGLLGSATSLFVLYQIISKMMTDIKETPAYRLGIVDEKGRILKKSKDRLTQEEKDSMTLLDVFVFNLKRLLGPLGRSKIATITASAFLLKEFYDNDGWYDSEGQILLLNTRYREFEKLLTEEDMRALESIHEDAIANVTGPAVAGTTGEPPGKKGIMTDKILRRKAKKKKKKKLVETTDPVINKKSVKGLLSGVKKKILHKHLTIDQIADIIEVTLKRKFDIDVEVVLDQKTPDGSINLSADYDPHDDEMGDTSIRIKFHVKTKKEKLFLSDDQWHRFSNEIAMSLEHEYLHMAQYRNRSYKDGTKFQQQKFVRMSSELKDMFAPAQNYFGRPDEIEAFALNSATELMTAFKSKGKAIKALKRMDGKVTKASPTIFRYMMTFGYDFKNPTIRKFLQKVFLYLNRK